PSATWPKPSTDSPPGKGYSLSPSWCERCRQTTGTTWRRPPRPSPPGASPPWNGRGGRWTPPASCSTTPGDRPMAGIPDLICTYFTLAGPVGPFDADTASPLSLDRRARAAGAAGYRGL